MEKYEEMFIDDIKHNQNLFVCDAAQNIKWVEFCSDYHNFDSIKYDDNQSTCMPRMMEVIYLDPTHTHAVVFLPDYVYTAIWVTRREKLHWLSHIADVRVTTSIRAFASFVTTWAAGLDDRIMNILGALKFKENNIPVYENDYCFFEKNDETHSMNLILCPVGKDERKTKTLPFDITEYINVQRQLAFNWNSMKRLKNYYVNVGWAYRFLTNSDYTFSGIEEANRYNINSLLTYDEEELDYEGILRYDNKKENYVVFDERNDDKAFAKAMSIESYVDQTNEKTGETMFVKRAIFVNKLHTSAVVLLENEKVKEHWIDHCISLDKGDKLISVKTVRVVSSLEQFFEKVLLVSLGLPDITVEAYKDFMICNDNELHNKVNKAIVQFENDNVNYKDLSNIPLSIQITMNNGGKKEINLDEPTFWKLNSAICDYLFNNADTAYVVDDEYGHKLMTDLITEIETHQEEQPNEL